MSENGNTPTIVTPTRCKLCGKLFPPDILSTATLLGQRENAQAAQIQTLMQPLMKHLAEVHQKPISSLGAMTDPGNRHYMHWVELQAATYRGLLYMLAFEGGSPEFEAQRDQVRFLLHNQTQRVHVSDSRITERVRAMVLKMSEDADMDLQESVEALMRQLRDAYEERDRYPKVESVSVG